LALTGVSEGSAVTNPAGLQEPTRKERHKEGFTERYSQPSCSQRALFLPSQNSWGMISPFQPKPSCDSPARPCPKTPESPHPGGEGGYLRSAGIRRRPARSRRSAVPSPRAGSCTAPFPGRRRCAESPPGSTGKLRKKGEAPASKASHRQPLSSARPSPTIKAARNINNIQTHSSL